MKINATANFLLWAESPKEEDSLDFWIRHIAGDRYYSGIINSAAFKRLAGISFLGALDYTVDTKNQLPAKHKTRANHSVSVAGIAAFVAAKRGYDEEQARHIIVAALLHDIGHPPLSHSVEPYIKQRLGYGHHEAGEKIIRGDVALGRTLYKKLLGRLDISHLLNLIAGTADSADGGDLFSSAFNIDTIDGIVRSYTYMRPEKKIGADKKKLMIAKAAFIDREAETIPVLDDFWAMKHAVYANFINNKHGLISDKASELYFAHQCNLDENEIYQTESDWRRTHAVLFDSLEKWKNQKAVAPWIEGEDISFVQREYKVDKLETGNARFVCNKTKTKISLSTI